jgi:hypothetical protein
VSNSNRLLSILRSLSPVDVQNRLMIISDRELALGMMYMSDKDRNYVFSFLSKTKAGRVHEEIIRQQNQYITYKQYEVSTAHLIQTLIRPGKRTALKSYLRPHRGRRRNE